MAEEEPKCKPGSIEHATFRRADAEHRKVEELARWREMVADFIGWLKQQFTQKGK